MHECLFRGVSHIAPAHGDICLFLVPNVIIVVIGRKIIANFRGKRTEDLNSIGKHSQLFPSATHHSR